MLPVVDSGRRRALALGVVALLLLLAYVVVWLRVDPANQLRSDFVGVYQGATLLRQEGGAHLYDLALGVTTPHALGLPSGNNSVFFVDAPPAAAIMLPFTFLDVHDAWRAWSLLQLVAVLAAVAITAMAAPWPRRDPALRVTAALLGAAGVGTLVILLQAQWSGLFALGVAGGYALWRRGNHAAGTAVALLPMALIKPNLALGLVLFLIGWGNRRIVASVIACAVGAVVLSFAVAGVHGMMQFLPAVLHDSQRWTSSSMNGFAGLVASLFGTGTPATAVGLAGSLAAVIAAFALGRHVRRPAPVLEPALAGALSLTLLASPHLYDHDLALLAPALVLGIATASRIDAVRGSTIPGSGVALVSVLWLALIAVGPREFGAATIGFPGRLVPWFLIAFAALAFVGVRRVAAAVTPPVGPGATRRPMPLPAERRESPASARTPAGTTPRGQDAAHGWSAAAIDRRR